MRSAAWIRRSVRLPSIIRRKVVASGRAHIWRRPPASQSRSRSAHLDRILRANPVQREPRTAARHSRPGSHLAVRAVADHRTDEAQPFTNPQDDDGSGDWAVTPEMIDALSQSAGSSLRIKGGGYRRDHLRAFAQRVEVADDEVRIMGRTSDLLQTLVAASSGETAAFAVRSSVLKWRTRQDSNLWPLPSEGSALSS